MIAVGSVFFKPQQRGQPLLNRRPRLNHPAFIGADIRLLGSQQVGSMFLGHAKLLALGRNGVHVEIIYQIFINIYFTIALAASRFLTLGQKDSRIQNPYWIQCALYRSHGVDLGITARKVQMFSFHVPNTVLG